MSVELMKYKSTTTASTARPEKLVSSSQMHVGTKMRKENLKVIKSQKKIAIGRTTLGKYKLTKIGGMS